MPQIPESNRLETMVTPEHFAEAVKWHGQSALVVSAAFAAITALVMLAWWLLWPDHFPTPTLIVRAFSRSGRRHFTEPEDLAIDLGVIGLFVIVIGFVFIHLFYVKGLRRDTVSTYCRRLGLRYILNTRVRRRFLASEFHERGLVPSHHNAVVDDLIGWQDGEHSCILAELQLIKTVLGRRAPATVFKGTLIGIEVPQHRPFHNGATSIKAAFEKDADGKWAPTSDLSALDPRHKAFIDRIGALADVLEAREVAAAFSRTRAHLAIPSRRDSIPLPKFWWPGGRNESFTRICRDLHAMAELCHALADGREPSKPIQALPARLDGRYPLPWLFWVCLVPVGGLFLAAALSG